MHPSNRDEEKWDLHGNPTGISPWLLECISPLLRLVGEGTPQDSDHGETAPAQASPQSHTSAAPFFENAPIGYASDPNARITDGFSTHSTLNLRANLAAAYARGARTSSTQSAVFSHSPYHSHHQMPTAAGHHRGAQVASDAIVTSPSPIVLNPHHPPSQYPLPPHSELVNAIATLLSPEGNFQNIQPHDLPDEESYHHQPTDDAQLVGWIVNALRSGRGGGSGEGHHHASTQHLYPRHHQHYQHNVTPPLHQHSYRQSASVAPQHPTPLSSQHQQPNRPRVAQGDTPPSYHSPYGVGNPYSTESPYVGEFYGGGYPAFAPTPAHPHSAPYHSRGYPNVVGGGGLYQQASNNLHSFTHPLTHQHGVPIPSHVLPSGGVGGRGVVGQAPRYPMGRVQADLQHGVPVACQHCGERFVTTASYFYHQRTVHGRTRRNRQGTAGTEGGQGRTSPPPAVTPLSDDATDMLDVTSESSLTRSLDTTTDTQQPNNRSQQLQGQEADPEMIAQLLAILRNQPGNAEAMVEQLAATIRAANNTDSTPKPAKKYESKPLNPHAPDFKIPSKQTPTVTDSSSTREGATEAIKIQNTSQLAEVREGGDEVPPVHPPADASHREEDRDEIDDSTTAHMEYVPEPVPAPDAEQQGNENA